MAAKSGHLDVCELLIVCYKMIEDTVHLNLLDFGSVKHPFYWAASEGIVYQKAQGEESSQLWRLLTTSLGSL